MAALGEYTPRDIEPDDWARIRPLVEQALAPVSDNLAAQSRYPASRMALFLLKAGHEPTLNLLLDERAVVHWLNTVELDSCKATYRSRLNAVRAVHFPHQVTAKATYAKRVADPEPYELDDIDRMLSHASMLSTERRRANAAAYVLLGVGAGCDGKDFTDLTGAGVVRDNGLVVVDINGSRKPRRVAVLRRYAERAYDMAQLGETQVPGSCVVGGQVGRKNITSRVNGYFTDWGGPTVSAQRLRATWLAIHIDAGTPLPVLMELAGVETLARVEAMARRRQGQRDLHSVLRMAAEALQ